MGAVKRDAVGAKLSRPVRVSSNRVPAPHSSDPASHGWPKDVLTALQYHTPYIVILERSLKRKQISSIVSVARLFGAACDLHPAHIVPTHAELDDRVYGYLRNNKHGMCSRVT